MKHEKRNNAVTLPLEIRMLMLLLETIWKQLSPVTSYVIFIFIHCLRSI